MIKSIITKLTAKQAKHFDTFGELWHLLEQGWGHTVSGTIHNLFHMGDGNFILTEVDKDGIITRSTFNFESCKWELKEDEKRR